MAFSGRIRCVFPLLGKILSADSSAVCARSAADLTLRNPSTGLRTFATRTKPTEANVKAPLSLFGGSGNYASALFHTASKANALDKVESEILDVAEDSKKSPPFSQFIKEVINEIISETKFSDVTKKFLVRIAGAFIELIMVHTREMKVTVTTAIPLTAEEEKELKLTLQEFLGQGKTVKIEHKVDPSSHGSLHAGCFF